MRLHLRFANTVLEPLWNRNYVSCVQTALENATGREVWCAMLMHDELATRVLVSSRSAISRVRDWLDEGVAWGEALARLHVQAASSAHASEARAPSDGDDA